MNYLEELNRDQLEAVKTTEGYLRVIAGAGSGKTKLLVSRYVYLVSEYGINPANVLCVTFTNKAAREMKQRIKALLGQDFDSSLICTYHGFCARVLREDSDKIFYPKNFQILDSDSQKGLLEDIYQQFELKLDHASFEKIIKQIGEHKKDYGYVEKMCSATPCKVLDKIESLDDQIIEEYFQRQIRSYALDFLDLLNFALYLFSKNPEVREKWQEKLNYIQVDEFQDSSSKELALIDVLSAKYKNLMIVGDPDQNIYEWRGSDVKLLVDFDKSHENCQTQYLTRNYRSTSKILHCANTLIEKNKYRLKKDLYTKNGEGADVLYYHEKNEHKEAERIVNIIKPLKNAGYNYSDFAVLYRSGFLSWPIEKKLNEESIPYEIFGGVKFYKRMEIQDVIAYLRLICFDDDISFKRIVNKPRRRFGKVKMQKLISLRQEDESLFDTLRKNLDDEVIKKSEAVDFVKLICDMRQRVLIDGVSDFVSALCCESGYENYIRELGDMERFDNLTEFKRMIIEQEKSEGEELSMEEFLGRIALQTDEEGSNDKDTVKLMTIHSSKGLEFPVVFLMGVSENVFPSPKTIEERGELGMEEERRLCYVAITRAKERLIITEAEGLSPRGKPKTPSRFLRDIGFENFRSFGINTEETLMKNFEDGFQKNYDLPDVSVGQVVNHPIFGQGEIKSINENGTNCKIKFLSDGKERNFATSFFGKNPLKVVEKTLSVEKNIRDTQSSKMIDIAEFDDKLKTLKNYLSGQPSEKQTQTLPPQQIQTEPITNQVQSMIVNENFSETGWRCVGVTDMGAPSVICQFCNKQTLRYVHHMEHVNGERLDVGCVCAGKMQGDIEKAKERERTLRERLSARQSITPQSTQPRARLLKSLNGNFYIRYKEHIIVFMEDKYNKGQWRYSIDGEFSKYTYETINNALEEAINNID